MLALTVGIGRFDAYARDVVRGNHSGIATLVEFVFGQLIAKGVVFAGAEKPCSVQQAVIEGFGCIVGQQEPAQLVCALGDLSLLDARLPLVAGIELVALNIEVRFWPVFKPCNDAHPVNGLIFKLLIRHGKLNFLIAAGAGHFYGFARAGFEELDEVFGFRLIENLRVAQFVFVEQVTPVLITNGTCKTLNFIFFQEIALTYDGICRQQLSGGYMVGAFFGLESAVVFFFDQHGIRAGLSFVTAHHKIKFQAAELRQKLSAFAEVFGRIAVFTVDGLVDERNERISFAQTDAVDGVIKIARCLVGFKFVENLKVAFGKIESHTHILVHLHLVALSRK